jgi:hypothetical protein
MVVAACGTIFGSACNSSRLGVGAKDAQSDSTTATKQDATGIVLPDAGATEANAPVDADQTDLWNIPCE